MLGTICLFNLEFISFYDHIGLRNIANLQTDDKIDMILFESTQQNKNKIQNNNTVYQKKNKVFIDAGYL